MHIEPEPPHRTSLIDTTTWERGGTHDNDGFVLAAHPGKSQGRPRMNVELSAHLSERPARPHLPQRPMSRATYAPEVAGRSFIPR